MGLDMYLTRKTYVKNHNPLKTDNHHQIDVKFNNKKHPYIDLNNITHIEEEVGYWRKANAIHNWFVTNVQNGIDNCGEYFVSIEQLEELYNTCKLVLEHKDDKEFHPETHLPTTMGFFFGEYDYDDVYYYDITKTIKIIEPLINLNKELEIESKKEINPIYLYPDYYYQSSW